jgi:1-acyl-sn-glycerol-3-phosphate acyltransferase
MGKTFQSWRGVKLARLLAHLLRGYVKVRWGWQALTPLQAQEEVMSWAKETLNILGARVKLEGQLRQTGPLLLVSNHVSWMDILLFLSLGPVRFVSKSEVQFWPVIGHFAQACRTLFIQRTSKRDARMVVQRMSESLQKGDLIAIFPEGTTTVGETVLPFHANLFESVVASNAQVQAAGILYVGEDEKTFITATSFTGEDTLVGSIWRILGLRQFDIWVCIGPEHDALGQNRRVLSTQSWHQVQALHSRLKSRTV